MNPSTQDAFRRAAFAENGISIAAGAQVVQVHLLAGPGRVVPIDLSEVPEDARAGLIVEMRQLRDREVQRGRTARSATPRPKLS